MPLMNDGIIRFRVQKDITPEFEEKLDRMLSNSVAIGANAWAPSFGALLPNSREDSTGNVNIQNESIGSYDDKSALPNL
ncbi:disease resistance protein RGA3 [Pyrus ussuriensis x Pyrus communis]|uniref:Disease resistance protein RGA3 n=1 Tax=Pyrus ussuriensis x Pyrus communis TaxID=2448454 RepID=A0A5N5ILS7_9ROSA|nr:disease resistance protein RGA3 [Pyrus ussuriensis x Pyrus communis]